MSDFNSTSEPLPPGQSIIPERFNSTSGPKTCPLCTGFIFTGDKTWLGLDGEKHFWCALKETGDDIKWENKDRNLD